MAFTYREGLDRPLTYQEMDDNLEYVEQLAQQSEAMADSAGTSAAQAEADRIAAQEAATQAQESAAGVAVLRGDLADPAKGAAMVAYGDGTVAEALDGIQPQIDGINLLIGDIGAALDAINGEVI